MAKPIPVLTGSEYRDMKTMKKHVMQKTTGMKSGTCGKVTTANRQTYTKHFSPSSREPVAGTWI